ncbi:MAG: hypothetical protein EOO77_21100 [Oxalobacteraceae bacterium]|nr:MAG: hypothetical protein EOO77_21100 [Oxalobacteraceae bacterium]
MTQRTAYAFIAQPIRQRRRNEHSLRCVFRKLVNGGKMLDRDYDHFLELVDRYEDINQVIRYLNGECCRVIRARKSR